MRAFEGVRETGLMVEALTRKLSGFFQVSEATAKDLVKLCSETRIFAPKERIAESGQAYRGIYLVHNGWALRSRVLENGSRQIVNVAMAGDFLGLNAMIFDSSDFDIVAKTEVDGLFHPQGRAARRARPRPAARRGDLLGHGARGGILAERIVSLGRRSVRVRTAHVLCEFISRLEIIEPEAADELLIPLTQEDFSDILGTSLVHTNKTLRSLDRDGIIQFRQGLLRVNDRRELERTAGFERGYLHFTQVRPGRAMAGDG